MDEKIAAKFEEIKQKNPQFPDGRIDYANAEEAMAVNIFVRFDNKILLVKRSEEVKYYKGKWNSPSGFYDEPVGIREKALKELAEETGITEANLTSLHIGEPFSFTDKEKDISWFIIPVLVELSHAPDIALDEEHAQMQWVDPEEIEAFNTIPYLPELYRHVAA